ncbi:MAG: hypothetical protein AAB583_02015 [Patescibacteria group bacterium]
MQKGYIALITVLIVMSVVLTTASTVALLAIGEAQSGFSLFKGEDTLTFVEGCVEDGLLKSRADASYSGGTIERPEEGSCSIAISKVSIPWTMTVTTSITTYKRTIEIKYTRNPTGITLSSWKEI